MVGTLVGVRALLGAGEEEITPFTAVTSHLIDCPISAACVV